MQKASLLLLDPFKSEKSLVGVHIQKENALVGYPRGYCHSGLLWKHLCSSKSEERNINFHFHDSCPWPI